MIISELTGGLGNQLFQYAAGLALAAPLSQDLLLYCRWYENRTDRQFMLHRFGIRGRVVRGCLGQIVRLWNSPRFGSVARCFAAIPPVNLRLIDEERSGWVDPAQVGSRNVLLRGNWESEDYFVDVAELLRKDIQLISAPDPRNAELIARIEDSEAVCVHVRRTDKLSPSEARKYSVCEEEYYHAAAALINERVERPTYYVFSDEPAWAAEHIHLGVASVYVSHNGATAPEEDFRLMTACKHFIIAKSTFSWWAAWLGRFPSKLVVAPERWRLNPDFRRKAIVPRSWMTI